MAEAAKYYEEHPAALRLRELQTLVEVAKEKNMVIITPTSMGAETSLLAAALSKQKSGSEKSG